MGDLCFRGRILWIRYHRHDRRDEETATITVRGDASVRSNATWSHLRAGRGRVAAHAAEGGELQSVADCLGFQEPAR